MKVKRTGNSLGWGLVMALAINLIMWAPGAKAADPMSDIKSLITEVQTILQTKTDKAQRLNLIEKATANHLDFREMAQRCLGSNWASLSAAQKDEFVHLFSELLKAHYAKHLDDFAKTKVEYKDATCNGNSAEVRISVIRPNDRIPVNFRLLQKGANWMIYDLNIEGLSMVSNFKTQFSQAICMSSYQGLVARLKARLKAETAG